ncbi:MAG: dCMP deaminase family protein [Nanoarchaeota archaeon]
MDWDEYFIKIAETVRLKSKDPSSQIGAVIIGPENQIISTGYNGFPRKVGEQEERWQRPLKYEYVCHAEVNSIYNAARHGIALRGTTLYLVGFGPPTLPCMDCSKAIIQSGIVKVVGAAYKPIPENWLENLKKARTMLEEGGVEFIEFVRKDLATTH